MNNIDDNSHALWNRIQGPLNSDEVLAQVLDRGDLSDWRELYRLAQSDPGLRRRIMNLVLTVALPLPHFWLAALASLGESVDWNARLPNYFESTTI